MLDPTALSCRVFCFPLFLYKYYNIYFIKNQVSLHFLNLLNYTIQFLKFLANSWRALQVFKSNKNARIFVTNFKAAMQI